VNELAVILERKNQEINKLGAQIQELNAMGVTINSLQERIQKLVGENKGL
jgi:prefoldin subunit 5